MSDTKNTSENQQPAPRPEKPLRRHTRWLNRQFLSYAVVFAVIALTGAGYAAFRLTMMPYEGDDAVRIYIPENANENAVYDTLCTRLGDNFGQRVYKLWMWRNRNEHRPAFGSYVINPGDKPWTISNSLFKNRQTPVKVTFNNVRLMSQLAERVGNRMAFGADTFMLTADTVLPSMGFARPEVFPSAFVPDTYEFYWTEPANKVIRDLVKTRNEFWTKERVALAEKAGLTPLQVTTLASIVEEETRDDADRAMVARLYMNRLGKGMKLQADPTVKFAAGNFGARRIKGDMLKTVSDYNTYRVQGLPPGPIRIPERTTMDIVLHAPQHDYLYMCASPKFNGTHDYAVDYETHKKNARAYQAELDRRGIHK